MVPGPPISLQLRGDTVLVISLISISSIVWLGPRFCTPTAPGAPDWLANGAAGAGPAPVEVPVGVPGGSVKAPVTGVGAVPWSGWVAVAAACTGEVAPALTSPKFSMGMTR